MGRKTIFLAVVALTLLLFQSFSFASAGKGNLSALCYKIESDYIPISICNEFFGRDPRSSTADYYTLAIVALDVVASNVTGVQASFEKSLKTEKDPVIRRAVEACSKHYSDSMPALKEAEDDVKIKNYAGASAALYKLESDAGQACVDEFPPKRHDVDPAMESVGLMWAIVVARAVCDFLQVQ